MTMPEFSSLARLIEVAADRYGEHTAIVDRDARLTYSQLVEESREFGAALVASGVGKGDRVSIWAPNSVEWVTAVLGLFQAGATLVPINTRYKGAEAADMLRRARVKVLVTATEFLGTDYVAMLREAAPELPDLRDVVVARGPVVNGTVGWAEFLGRADDVAREEVAKRSSALGPDDPSDILFTSGTTGVPKGVVMTHARTLRVATDWVAMTGLRAGDVYLMVNPYFHMFGLKAGILASLAAGATMLPEPTFDLDRALQRVQDEKVTVFPGAPTIYQALLDHPSRDDHDLSTLRIAVTGAADIPVELIRRISAEMPFETIISGYGLSEAGTASSTGLQDDVAAIATTVGRVRPGFELCIVDQDGNPVADGQPGEVLLRGGSVMSHYLDDPEATAAAFTAEGYLRTGDLGVLDDEGRLRIVGRVKDMFIVGGFNAYPAEIENSLRRHPAVRDAAVVGIPDERLGEVGMAFVVRESDSTATAEEIIAWSKDEMANFKVPRRVEFLDALPLNATGKVEKTKLRDLTDNVAE